MSHEADDPVIFHYAATCNVTFTGEDESGLTWGEWRQMDEKDEDEARLDFIFNQLGVEVWEVDT